MRREIFNNIHNEVEEVDSFDELLGRDEILNDSESNIEHVQNIQTTANHSNEATTLSTENRFDDNGDEQFYRSQDQNLIINFTQNYSQDGQSFFQNNNNHNEQMSFLPYVYSQAILTSEQHQLSDAPRNQSLSNFNKAIEEQIFNSNISSIYHNSVSIKSTNEDSQEIYNSQPNQSNQSGDIIEQQDEEDNDSVINNQQNPKKVKGKRIQKQKQKKNLISDKGTNSNSYENKQDKKKCLSEFTKNHLRNFYAKQVQIIREIKDENDWPIKRIRNNFQNELTELEMSIDELIIELKELVASENKQFNLDNFANLYQIPQDLDQRQKLIKMWFREFSFIFFSEKVPQYLFFDNVRVGKEVRKLCLDLIPSYLKNIIEPTTVKKRFNRNEDISDFKKLVSAIYQQEVD